MAIDSLKRLYLVHGRQLGLYNRSGDSDVDSPVATQRSSIYFGTRGNRCKCGSSRFYASRGGPPMSYL
jgi:hypothetical protein